MPPSVLVTTYQAADTIVGKTVICSPAFVMSVIYRFDLNQIGTIVVFIRDYVESGCPTLREVRRCSARRPFGKNSYCELPDTPQAG